MAQIQRPSLPIAHYELPIDWQGKIPKKTCLRVNAQCEMGNDFLPYDLAGAARDDLAGAARAHMKWRQPLECGCSEPVW